MRNALSASVAPVREDKFHCKFSRFDFTDIPMDFIPARMLGQRSRSDPPQAQPLSAFESDQLHCTSSLLDSMHTDGPLHNFTKHPDLPGPEDGAPTLALARADGQHAVLGARTSAGAGKPGKARSMRDTGAGLSLALYRACTLHNPLRRPSSALNQPLPATDSSLSTPPCKEARPCQLT